MKVFRAVKVFFSLLILFFSFSFAKADFGAKKFNVFKHETVLRVAENGSVKAERFYNVKFEGNFHRFAVFFPVEEWGIISNVKVKDLDLNQDFKYSPVRLNGSFESSWGKYATYTEGESHFIEFYFNVQDTNKQWLVEYDFKNAFKIGEKYDSLILTIAGSETEYMEEAKLTIYFPRPLKFSDLFFRAGNTNDGRRPQGFFDKEGKYAIDLLKDLKPKDYLFVDIGFAKNILQLPYSFEYDITKNIIQNNQKLIFKNWLLANRGYVLSGLFLLIGLCAGFLSWLYHKKIAKGTGTVIPRYEPPLALKPQLAEVLLLGKSSLNGVAATLINLYFRGFLGIEREKSIPSSRTLVIKSGLSLVLFSTIFLIYYLVYKNLSTISGWFFSSIIFLLVLLIIALFLELRFLYQEFFNPSYKLVKLKSYLMDSSLDEYERELLYAFFSSKDECSFSELRAMNNIQFRYFNNRIDIVLGQAYHSTEKTTSGYKVGFINGNQKAFSWFLVYIVTTFYLKLTSLFFSQNWLPYITGFVVFVATFIYIKYQTRLSHKGRLLKEEWEGFRLYLLKTEKFRMQDVEVHEQNDQNICYAVVFGVENKFSKAFARIFKRTTF